MVKTSYISFILFILLILLFQDCKHDDNTVDKPNCTSTFIPKAYNYKVVGFYPSWEQEVMPIAKIKWEKLTRIVYAFAIPNADGTLNTDDLVNIGQLADSAHAHGVEVYFSVGGGDGSGNFPVLAANKETRDRFISEVQKYLFENCLDGVDIDWEYWSGYTNNIVVPAESNSLVTIVSELKKLLSPYKIGISIDVGATDWSGKHFFNDVQGFVNDVMVMCYDFTGTWTDPGPHSAFADAVGSGSTVSSTGLAYWTNYRGWPKNKILLGVPFYGKDFDQSGGLPLTYEAILERFPNAYKFDRINNIYYDGIGTMAEKAQYVSDYNFSGIMIWEITQDSPVDSISLLNAIDNVLFPDKR